MNLGKITGQCDEFKKYKEASEHKDAENRQNWSNRQRTPATSTWWMRR